MGMFHRPNEFYPYLPILNFFLASLCLNSVFPTLSLVPLTSKFCSQPFLSTPSFPFPLTLASVFLICVWPLLGTFSLFFFALLQFFSLCMLVARKAVTGHHRKSRTDRPSICRSGAWWHRLGSQCPSQCLHPCNRAISGHMKDAASDSLVSMEELEGDRASLGQLIALENLAIYILRNFIEQVWTASFGCS